MTKHLLLFQSQQRELTMHAKPASSFISCLLICIVGIAGTLIAPPAMAQSLETFMKIDGVPGESVARGHENEIDLTSYSQTFATKNCSRVVAMKFIDRSSPALISRAAGNVLLPSVIISIRESGERPVEFFRAILESVLIDRIELTEGNGNGRLDEQVVLRPRNIQIEYRQQDKSGQVLPPIVTKIACN